MKQLLALLFSAVLLVVGAMFSLVFLALFAVLGVIGISWFWWKTRALRKALREQAAQRPTQPQSSAPDGGVIIEGEAVVVRENSANQPALPHHPR